MIKAISKLKTHFANWRQWELNAIVVKELRQAVRSWAVTGMLLLFLAVLFFTAVGFLISQSFTAANQRLGADVFQAFVIILTAASIVFIPTYVGTRLAIERQETNLDLLYVSALTPGSIIRGKLLCGAYTTLLFFSACMPFMTFTNLLRGIDLPTIFLILLYLFFVMCAAVQVAIFLACLPISRAFKVLLGLAGVIAALLTVASLSASALLMMRSGAGAVFITRGVTTASATGCAVIVSLLLLLYFLSVALISPPSANRALPVRLYVTLIWFLGAALSFYWVLRNGDLRLIYPWGILTFLVMVLSLIVVVSNHDEISPRVRRRIPPWGLKRALAFLIFNGAAGGLTWVVLLLCVTFGATLVAGLWLPSWSRFTGTSDMAEFLRLSAVALSYSLAYAMTGLLIHRKLLAKRSPKIAGLLCLMIAAGTALIPGIVLFVANRLSVRTIQKLQPGNVFNAFAVTSSWEQMVHLYVALGWMLLVIALNAKWFLKQVHDFRPLDNAAEVLPKPVAPPPLPAQS